MAITYTISGGADAAKFNIDANTGALTFKAAPDFEKPGDANADNVYEVDVIATDATGLASAPKPVKVTVTDVSEGAPPQITSAGAISVKENQTIVMTVTATDPDDTTNPPDGGQLPPLVTSGTVNATSNMTIENKDITGNVVAYNVSNVIIKNCIIRHPGGNAVHADTVTGITITDVQTINTAAPTGQKPVAAEDRGIYLNAVKGTISITRFTCADVTGLYAYRCTAPINISFMEGHKLRGPAPPKLMGQLCQYNQCSGGGLMEDFSCESPGNDSWVEDNMNLYQCTGNWIFRRGLIDGNNSPSGCAFMIEGTPNVLVEDVDALHQGNGGPAVYSGGPSGPDSSANCIYRRFRIKDTIQSNQGRGVPQSGYCTYVSSPGVVGSKYEQCKHFNVLLNNLAWDVSTMATKDWSNTDFTPRAPVRNRKPGT